MDTCCREEIIQTSAKSIDDRLLPFFQAFQHRGYHNILESSEGFAYALGKGTNDGSRHHNDIDVRVRHLIGQCFHYVGDAVGINYARRDFYNFEHGIKCFLSVLPLGGIDLSVKVLGNFRYDVDRLNERSHIKNLGL